MKPQLVCGLPNAAAKAFFVLKESAGKNSVFVSGEDEAADFCEAFSALGPLISPGGAPESVFFSDDEKQFSAALHSLAGKKAAAASQAAFLRRIPSPEDYRARSRRLSAGDVVRRSELLSLLDENGYSRVEFAEQPGEYAVRGSVVDVFCLSPAAPARLFFAGDRIESAKFYEVENQTTTARADFVDIIPAKLPPGNSTLADWIPPGFFCAADETADFDNSVFERAGKAVLFVPAGTENSENYGILRNAFFGANAALAAKEIQRLKNLGLEVIVSCLNRGELDRLEEFLGEETASSCRFAVSGLREGFIYEPGGIAVIASCDILSRVYGSQKLLGKFDSSAARRIRFKDLKAGDFVVHENYGIGRYLGLKTMPENDAEGVECLSLEYRGGHRLFVPLYDFKKVRKFIGSRARPPRLSGLGGRAWAQVKARVREAAREAAAEILRLEAERFRSKAEVLAGDSHIEREFSDSFPHEETPDQSLAIKSVLSDLSLQKPMDRLLVGDVGFGKTEVAMRAALRCVLGGKQALILAPTTVLAAQHYRNFTQRLAAFPVRTALLCRFQKKEEQKKIISDVKAGFYDVVIGTHRLFSKDVAFKSLGLCVIDEEHRFGVRQKEKIKALRAGAHTLMLSATPIPRTLYQALSSLREISAIETPPSGRMPIATRVLAWDENAAAQAIRREIARGGQVYYVHNRVRSLPARFEFLKALVPEARICMAHGQMSEGALEKAMWDFFNGKYDVLLSSAIIESGLDIPRANTLIAENSHEFGLAQLYQLRGRIGRGDKKAFCCFFHPSEKSLGEEARQRLEALMEFCSLGSGMRLALRDLEIRGAGELLGVRQHGFIEAVGLSLYCEMLEEEARGLRGGKPPQAQLPPFEVSVPAFIPPDYLPDETERLSFYHRLVSGGDAAAVLKNLEDVCGPAPQPVKNIVEIMELRSLAGKLGVRKIEDSPAGLELYFSKGAPAPSPEKLISAGVVFLPSPLGDGLLFAGDETPLLRARAALELLSAIRPKC